MFRTLLLSIFLAVFTISSQAQGTKAEASVQVMLPEVKDMDLLSSWKTGNRDFNDVWGYVDSEGNEVGIIGSRSHYYFVDISDPTDPELINGFAGGNVTIWRDMKTYGQWAYGVCDSCNEGLSIFKLGDSPKDNGVQFVQQNNNFFGSAHNIFIDEEHGRLYAIGTNTQRNGVIILDIKTNPEAPILLAAVNVPGGYMHDLYVRNHIGYGNSEGRGLFVYNFSNPTSPQFLGSMTSYLQQGYNHSCWLNPAGDVLIMADETFNTSLKAVDVSDLSDIEVTSLFRSELLAPAATGSIAHNPFVRDNYAIVSYYHDGIQVFDISDPANVQQVAWYDTFTANTNYNGFAGAWGAYPFLPSGNILGSDDANGLFVLKPTQITFDPIPLVQPPFAFINEDVSPCVPTGTPVNLTLTTDAHTIQWFRNGTLVGFDTNFTATSEGTYTAIVYKGPHSLIVDPIEIVYGDAPDVTLNVASEVNVCEGEAIELLVPSGADSYEWFLDGNSVSTQGNSIMAAEPGVYTITATTGTCNATSAPVTVMVNELPEAIINEGSEITICEGDSFILTTNSEGDTYEWIAPTGDNISSEVMASVSDAGAYILIVTKDGCVTLSEEVIVNIVQAPEVIFDDSQSFTFCEGETFILTVLTQGVEYSFNTPSGITISGSDNFLEISESTELDVTVTTEFCTSTATVNIVEAQSPISIINSVGDQSICNGESTMLASQNDAESYQWFLDGMPISDASANTYQANASGNYTLQLTTSFGCTDLSDAFTLEVLEIPVIEYVSESSITICEGETTILQISGNAERYGWFDENLNPIGTGATQEVNNSDVVTAVAYNGNCVSNELVFIVEVLSIPNMTVMATDQTICAGETTTLFADSDTDNFIWIRNGETIAQNQNELIVDLPGVYSIQTQGSPCFASSPDIVISAGTPPNTNINSNFEIALCEGDTYTIEAAAGQASYTWFRNGLPIDDATANTFVVNFEGSYMVQITSADGCFGESNEYNFTYIPLPDATIQTASEQNICEGTSVLLESSEIAANYMWTLNGQLISTEANLEANQAGVYQLELISATGCGNLSQEITINVDANPVIMFNIEPDITLCEGESFTTNFDFDFDAYQWFLEGQPFSTDENIEISESGIYYLEATSNNCTGTSGVLDVLVQALPSAEVNILEGSTDCEGGTTLLLAPPGAQSYTWYLDDDSLTETSNQLIVEQTGTYRLELSDGICSNSSDEIFIMFSPNPDAVIAGEATQTICAGEFIVLETTSMADSYTWFLDGVALMESESTIDITQAGEYTLMTTLGDCETLSEPVSVEVLEAPTLSPDLFQDYILCEGEPLIIAVNIQEGEITLYRDDEVISAGETTFDLTTPGVYYFDYQIGDCISRSDDLTVSLAVLPSLADLPISTSLCLGEEFTYNAPAGLDSYVWNRDGNIIAGATTNELRVDEAGVYSLTIEQDGCTDQSDDLVVTFTTLPSLDDLPTTTSLCAGEEFIFEAPAGLDSYVWSKDGDVIAGATTNELPVGEEGTYSLIIEQNGCSASSVALEIEVITLDPLEVAPSTTFICGDEEVLLFLDVFNYDSIFLASNGEIISSNQDEIFVSESGIYTLIGKTGNCTIESNFFEFIFSDFPEITPVASEAFACPGETATLAVTGQEDLEYTWSNEGGQVVGTGMSVEVTIPGVYTSEVLDQETGCAMSTSITFSNYEITIPTIMVDENNLTSSDGEAYQWYVDGVLIPDANAITFTADGTGDYQVAVTDMNGCIIFSEVVFIELTSTQTISDILSADLFPNPTSDRLALTLTTGASLDLEITVYNQLGQSIWTTQVQQLGEQSYTIPVMDMTAGLYYLRVKNKQGHQQTYKFIKQ